MAACQYPKSVRVRQYIRFRFGKWKMSVSTVGLAEVN